ncbi:MAG: hypothetical protein FWB97_01360 [Oscillospiraceae bacterium]|nr:hypothetical protein [Oscillospiraceae bacterium]
MKLSMLKKYQLEHLEMRGVHISQEHNYSDDELDDIIDECISSVQQELDVDIAENIISAITTHPDW